MSGVLPASTSVRVHGLSKRYRIGAQLDRDESLVASVGRQLVAPVRNYRRLRDLRRFGDDGAEPNVIWALRDVSFELAPGDVLGVVGRNGAGKSTLLKVLARITEPTTGRVDLRGRVASLLEVGTGFHPDLTGRENVFLNGTMLGMSRGEVASRLEEILEFAEIRKFADTPVKRYSSGMYVRLAFSVAAHLDPDVLIADEVLAVGDAEFQRKSLGEMRSVAEGGRTVIFVSHNHGLVSSLCTRAIWLEQGRLMAEGAVEDVMAAYAASLQTGGAGDVRHRTDRLGNGRVQVSEAFVREPGAAATSAVVAGRPLELVVRYDGSDSPVGRLAVAVTIETLLRERIATVSNVLSGDTLESVPGNGELVCRLDGLPLNEGDYMCTVKLEVDGLTADHIADTTRFHVNPSGFYPTNAYPGARSGPLLLEHSWRLEA
jgi:lipopolysaccharide transport system ATP-binding protein